MTERSYTKAMGRDDSTGSRPMVEAPFGKALLEVAERRDDIVGLTADLGKYTDILPFRDAHPDRFFNVGMAEQNLVAVRRALRGQVSFLSPPPMAFSRRVAPMTISLLPAPTAAST